MKVLDEKQLWVRYKESGDTTAREELVLRNMKIVRYIAGRMAMHVYPAIDMDDLVGWGIVGLLDAVDRFDHNQETKFTTFASIRVRGAILDQVRTLDWAPRSLRPLGRKIGAAREKLRADNNREPTSEEIAEELGLTPDKVEETIAQIQAAHILSLDDYLPSERPVERRRLNLTSDSSIPAPDEALWNKQKQELLVEAILQLPEQQQKVLNLYYYQQLTLKEIGAVLEVSESRVCQIHSAAMNRLRKIVQGTA